MIKGNIHKQVIENSTNEDCISFISGLEAFYNFYGVADKKNVCSFLGITEKWYDRHFKKGE